MGNVKREKNSEEGNSSQLSVARRHELWANKCCANGGSEKNQASHEKTHTHTHKTTKPARFCHAHLRRPPENNSFLLENKEYSSVYVS